MVLGVAIVSLVTVGSRCAVAPAVQAGPTAPDTVPAASICHGLPAVLIHFLQSLTPSMRLLVMTVVPLVLVGGLWFVSRRSSARYQTASDSDAPVIGSSQQAESSTLRPEDDAIPLARHDLWSNATTTSRLRLLHVQAGCSRLAGCSRGCSRRRARAP